MVVSEIFRGFHSWPPQISSHTSIHFLISKFIHDIVGQDFTPLETPDLINIFVTICQSLYLFTLNWRRNTRFAGSSSSRSSIQLDSKPKTWESYLKSTSCFVESMFRVCCGSTGALLDDDTEHSPMSYRPKVKMHQ